MRKIVLAILMMALFAGSAIASDGWIGGGVTTGSTIPHSYQIEIAQDGTVLWRTIEHIDDPYFSIGLDPGKYTVRCTIYDDHGVSIAAQPRIGVVVVSATFTNCSFVFTNGTALSRSTWGFIKASLL